MIAPPFIAYINERFGRRLPMLLGAVLCVAGALVVTFSQNTGMLIGGRVILCVLLGLSVSGFGTLWLTAPWWHQWHWHFRSRYYGASAAA